MALTISGLFGEARVLLSDTLGTPTTRYADADLLAAFNDAMQQARIKRPDLFLGIGLRNTIPQYVEADVSGSTAFPLDGSVYPAFLYYIVGRSELREDTFADNNRAVTLMNKFVSQLMQVMS
jgi:hypothetical protein